MSITTIERLGVQLNKQRKSAKKLGQSKNRPSLAIREALKTSGKKSAEKINAADKHARINLLINEVSRQLFSNELKAPNAPKKLKKALIISEITKRYLAKKATQNETLINRAASNLEQAPKKLTIKRHISTEDLAILIKKSQAFNDNLYLAEDKIIDAPLKKQRTEETPENGFETPLKVNRQLFTTKTISAPKKGAISRQLFK